MTLTMRRRLFIPGTGGCFFDDGNGTRHASILDLALDHQKDFVCEHPDDPVELAPLRTSGLTDHGQPVRLTAAGPIRGVYDPFFDETVALGSTTKAYRFYDYDWRLDLRYNGELLWQWLQGQGAEEAWDVVCHSQGGLVLLWASLLAGAVRFPKFVRRLVFCGVPIQGTVNAASALTSGSQILPGLAADPATVRSWPSIYMMLPRWRLGVPGSSGAESFKESTWRRASLLAPGADLAQGISPALLARAQEWKRQIDAFDFAPLAAIDRFVICQGHQINTWARTPAFPMFPDLAGRRDGHILVDGDGLAPNQLSVQFLPPSLLGRASSLLVPVRSHALMCSSLHQVLLCNRIFS
jgi:hypothetical protein